MQNYMWDTVDFTDATNQRVYRSHIRRFFYVYSYASGLLVSFSLQQKFKNSPDFIHDIKSKFLSMGSSKTPVDIFASMW
jgi:oligoendopeptidase F